MSQFRPLDNQIHSYRKRKQISLDGTVGGLPSPRPRASHRYPGSEFIARGNGSPANAQYLGPWPADYEPSPGRMEIGIPEYEPYEVEHDLSATSPPLVLDPVRMDVPESEEIPSYNDCLMTERLLMEACLQALEPAPDPEPRLVDRYLPTDVALDGEGSLEEIVYYEFSFMQFQEIDNAIEAQISQDLAPPEPELPDPFEMQQVHEQQTQQLMDPFSMMGPGPMM